MSELISFIEKNHLSLVSVIIALLSIIIASKTLNHSKRTTIVIDKYEPLLRELANAKLIKIYDDNIFDFTKLNEVRNSYVYYAFSPKLKQKIESIIDNSVIYVEHRKKLENNLMSIISKEFEPLCIKELSEKNDSFVYEFSEVYFFDNDMDSQVRIFELFMSDKIYNQIASRKIKGAFKAYKFEQGSVYNEEIEEYVEEQFHVGHIIYNLGNIKIFEEKICEDEWKYYENVQREDYARHLEQQSKDIKEEIYFLDDYIKYEKAYNLIEREVIQIENLIQEHIKQMLIPNYKIKKLLRRN